MALDSRSAVPLYAQLKNILKREIQQGKYTEQLPTETELMEAFITSRTTVRQAVSALVREGVLQKIQGKGTFIASRTANVWLGVLSSLTEVIESMGMKPGIKLLAHGLGRDPRIASMFGHDTYYSVERLRLADGVPIAVERTHYPLEIGRKLEKYDLNKVTLYDVLEKEGVVLDSAEQRITAGLPSDVDASLLGISCTASVIAAERLTYDPEGQIVGYNVSVFRADRYAFYVKMYRRSGSEPRYVNTAELKE
jgi:GntR family transcriptional regulator